jgi:hypothetical protein
MTRVEQVTVPARARELAALDRVDYADCFAVAVSAGRTPEEWIRLAVDAMPALFFAARGAHRALGLRLAPADSPQHVIGWDILRSDPDEAVLGNTGLLGTPRIVGLTPPGRVVLATLIMFNGITGRMLWAAAAPVHRAVARHALRAVPALTPQHSRR